MDNKQAYELLMEWSSFAVDTYQRIPGNELDKFSVVMTLKPNPLNYDGMNDVKIEIWREKYRPSVLGRVLGVVERNVVMESAHHFDINDCITELNSRLNELQFKTPGQKLKELGRLLIGKNSE